VSCITYPSTDLLQGFTDFTIVPRGMDLRNLRLADIASVEKAVATLTVGKDLPCRQKIMYSLLICAFVIICVRKRCPPFNVLSTSDCPTAFLYDDTETEVVEAVAGCDAVATR
jgi:hypothetical protein